MTRLAQIRILPEGDIAAIDLDGNTVKLSSLTTVSSAILDGLVADGLEPDGAIIEYTPLRNERVVKEKLGYRTEQA